MESIPKSATDLLQLLQSVAEVESSERFWLDNGQLARISIERRVSVDSTTLVREEDEYPRAYVDLDVPRTEQAIVTSVVALRGEKVKKSEMLKVHKQLPAARWIHQALSAWAADEEMLAEP
jgi:hypothetical protein